VALNDMTSLLYLQVLIHLITRSFLNIVGQSSGVKIQQVGQRIRLIISE